LTPGEPELLAFSGWAEAPADRAAPAEGDLGADVVVIGGGLCGMSAALRLHEHGLDTALVESRFCGWGASSRNAGHLTPTIAGDPQLLATVFRRRAPELVRLADRAVRFTETLIDAHEIDCDYEAAGNVSVALTAAGMRRAEAIAARLAGYGAEVELVEGGSFGLPATMPGGILERLGGVLDPGRLSAGLRERLLASGVRVHEDSPAAGVERSGSGFLLTTDRARIRSRHVLLATNAFTRDLPFAPPRVVAPLWVTLAETEPLGDRIEATGWRSGAGVYTQHVVLESYRRTARGSVVFGSRRVEPARGLQPRTPRPEVVADILRGLRDRMPELGEVSLRSAWGGWIAMTPSWLPVAGRTADGAHYAVGFNGHGLAQAPYLGSLVADEIAGGPRHDDLAALWRESPRFLPAPLFSGPALRLGWAIDRLGDAIAGRRTHPGDRPSARPD
jgi:glycine/D-amino acid oxidase-like deaminating enzyme